MRVAIAERNGRNKMDLDFRFNRCDPDTEVCTNSFRHFLKNITPDYSCIFGEWRDGDVCIHLDERSGCCESEEACDDAAGTDFVTAAMCLIDDEKIDDAVELLHRRLTTDKIRSLSEWIIRIAPEMIKRSDEMRIARARDGAMTHSPTTEIHMAINRMSEADLRGVYREMLKSCTFDDAEMEIGNAIYEWLGGEVQR